MMGIYGSSYDPIGTFFFFFFERADDKPLECPAILPESFENMINSGGTQ